MQNEIITKVPTLMNATKNLTSDSLCKCVERQIFKMNFISQKTMNWVCDLLILNR